MQGSPRGRASTDKWDSSLDEWFGSSWTASVDHLVAAKSFAVLNERFNPCIWKDMFKDNGSSDLMATY